MTPEPLTESSRIPFLQAVCERPGDDGPRLMFADWLEERGEYDRAEFIRVQCQLANWPVELCDTILSGCFVAGQPPHAKTITHGHRCGIHQLRARERVLLELHAGEWTNSLPESLITKQCPYCIDAIPDPETNAIECRQCEGSGLAFTLDNIEFSRGFISSISLPATLLWGGLCERCDGEYGMQPLCPDCHGTGHIDGIGAELLRFNPITEVEAVGAEPHDSRTWYDLRRRVLHNPTHPQSDIPGEIWDLIEADPVYRQKSLHTAADASAALSRAIVDYYRAANGYPSLTPSEVHPLPGHVLPGCLIIRPTP